MFLPNCSLIVLCLDELRWKIDSFTLAHFFAQLIFFFLSFLSKLTLSSFPINWGSWKSCNKHTFLFFVFTSSAVQKYPVDFSKECKIFVELQFNIFPKSDILSGFPLIPYIWSASARELAQVCEVVDMACLGWRDQKENRNRNRSKELFHLSGAEESLAAATLTCTYIDIYTRWSLLLSKAQT